MKILRFMLMVAIVIMAAQNSYTQTRSDSVRDLSRKIDALTDELERIQLGDVAAPVDAGKYGLGPAGSKVYGTKKSGVTVAGYGDVLYQRYAKETDDGKSHTTKDNVDMYHAILYLGYRFNDWLVFNSETEFEHVNELAVEFAYIDMLFSKNFNLRSGLLLNPMGIMNEIHEPPTFLPTIRPRVENNIIPSTWSAIGIGAYGEIMEGLNYRAYLTEGLNAANFTGSGGIRNGRQAGARAIAEDFGITGKLEYTAISGIKIGASFYTGNSGQGLTYNDSATAVVNGEITAPTTIIEGHVNGSIDGFEFAALYAMGSIGEADLLSKATSQTIGSKNNGMYVTLGYDVLRHIVKNTEQQLLPFIHWEKYNTQAEVADGFTANKANDRSILAFGLAYRPSTNVIVKMDIRNNKNEVESGSTALDQINLVLGYMF